MSTTDVSAAQAYIDGLRALADLLEHHPGPSPILTAAAREAQTAIDNGWGYNAQENDRVQRMRRFLRSCAVCGSPVYEEPGYCTNCAFEGER